MYRANQPLVSELRVASRELVRRFGLMNHKVAGTDLSLSAVHAIIEIGRAGSLTAKQLGAILLLEKSSVSRMVRHLVNRGEISELRSRGDLRIKHLQLTRQGQETLRTIDAYAERQVSDALEQLDDSSQRCILEGLQKYSAALGNPPAPREDVVSRERFSVESGYAPTIIGRVIEMLLAHMNRHYGFGAGFEARIAADLADFVGRLDSPENEIWRAESAGGIIGSISIDGEDLGPGLAHLRWFVVSRETRGAGVGNALLERALDFCDARGFGEVQLWTVKGLDAARRLYLRHGFELTEEYRGDQWGAEVIEHRYVRRRT